MNIFRNFAFIVGLLGATAASAGDAASADVFMEPGGPLATRLLYPASYGTCHILDRQIAETWKMLRNNASLNLFTDIGKAISDYFHKNVGNAPGRCGEAILKTTGETYGETLNLWRDFERKMKRDGKIADPLTFFLECEGLRLEHTFMAIVAGLGFHAPKSEDISAHEKNRRWGFFMRHFGYQGKEFMYDLQNGRRSLIEIEKASLVYNTLTKVSASLIYNIFTYQAPQGSPISKLPDDLLGSVLEFAYGPLKYSLDTELFPRTRQRCVKSRSADIEFYKP
jgi:hypothetical protein